MALVAKRRELYSEDLAKKTKRNKKNDAALKHINPNVQEWSQLQITLSQIVIQNIGPHPIFYA